MIESNRPLPSLELAPGDIQPALTLSFVQPGSFREIVPEQSLVLPEGHWVAHAFLPDGRLYLRAPSVVEALLSADGRLVSCIDATAADPRTVEANLLNIVLGTALTLAGEEPLHGTALDLGGFAIGLLGHSGAGKSTLAACLIRHGARLLTDDLMRVEFVDGVAVIHAGPHRLKLFDEAARRYLPDRAAQGHFNVLSGKLMISPPGSRAVDSVPLSALYFLGGLPGQAEPSQVDSVPLSGDEKMRALLSSAMDDRNASPARLARQLRFIGRVSGSIGIRALRYPRRFEVMESVSEEIARTCRL